MSLALGACAARQAPAVQYSLGTARAEYRDYAGAKANICDAEPRWLSDELSAVNALLARQTWCAKNPEVGSTDLYYARTYVDGRTEWLKPVRYIEAASGSERA